MVVFYLFWLVLSMASSLFLLYQFKPDYSGSEFPMFMDIATIALYLPGFYLLLFSLPLQLFYFALRNRKGFVILTCLLYVAVLLAASTVIDFWSFNVRLTGAIVASSVGILHLMISLAIIKRCNFVQWR